MLAFLLKQHVFFNIEVFRQNMKLRISDVSARESATTNSNIICATDDDDTNSFMTAATLDANPAVITATTAADNLGFDHPDVVEQLMQYDFDFPDSRSQSICPAQDQGQGQSQAEAEPQTQYQGQSEAQTQYQGQCHSPSFEFQVRSYQLRYCKKKKLMFSSRITSFHFTSFHFIRLASSTISSQIVEIPAIRHVCMHVCISHWPIRNSDMLCFFHLQS
jgi:hypothetical protein